MRYVIAYDIPDDRRRLHTAKALLDFGKRIQESVFIADLDDSLKQQLLARLRTSIDAIEDTVHLFPVCRQCQNGIESLGRGPIGDEPEFYIL